MTNVRMYQHGKRNLWSFEFTGPGGIGTIDVSYRTPIHYRIKLYERWGHEFEGTVENVYSQTTGRHLNIVSEQAKKDRMAVEKFESELKTLLEYIGVTLPEIIA